MDLCLSLPSLRCIFILPSHSSFLITSLLFILSLLCLNLLVFWNSCCFPRDFSGLSSCIALSSSCFNFFFLSLSSYSSPNFTFSLFIFHLPPFLLLYSYFFNFRQSPFAFLFSLHATWRECNELASAYPFPSPFYSIFAFPLPIFFISYSSGLLRPFSSLYASLLLLFLLPLTHSLFMSVCLSLYLSAMFLW